jgi:hypothetical protein
LLQAKLPSGLMEMKICVLMFYTTPNVGLTYRVATALSRFSDKFLFMSFKNAQEEILT